tara:strand:- start:384 stop:632 length:249 start_codon:yes stop_codon:yes gene_type:complete
VEPSLVVIRLNYYCYSCNPFGDKIMLDITTADTSTALLDVTNDTLEHAFKNGLESFSNALDQLSDLQYVSLLTLLDEYAITA